MALPQQIPQGTPRPIEQLHHSLRAQDNTFSVSLEEFEADMQDDAARQELYTSLRQLDDTFTASFEQFSEDMGVKKKDRGTADGGDIYAADRDALTRADEPALAVAGSLDAMQQGQDAPTVPTDINLPASSNNAEQLPQPFGMSAPESGLTGQFDNPDELPALQDENGQIMPGRITTGDAGVSQALLQPDTEEDGFWSALGKSLRNSLDPRQIGGNLLDYAGDAAEMLNPFGLDKQFPQTDAPLFNEVTDDKITDRRGARLRDEAKADALPISDNARQSVLDQPGNPAAWGNLLGQGAGSIVQVGAASALGGPGAGVAAGAALGISSTKDTAREAGISDKEATITATVLAPVVGMLEELGLGFITKNKAASKLLQAEIIKRAVAYGEGKVTKLAVVRAASELLPEVVKRAAGRAATGAVGEAGTEFLQGVAEGEAQVIADELRGNEDAAPGQGRYGTTQGQVFSQAAEGAIAGALLGGAAGGVGGALQAQPAVASEEAAATPQFVVPTDVTPEDQQRAQQAFPQPVAVVRPTGQPMFDNVQVVGVSEDGTMARIVGVDTQGQPVDTAVPVEYLTSQQAPPALESDPTPQAPTDNTPSLVAEEVAPEVVIAEQGSTLLPELVAPAANTAAPVLSQEAVPASSPTRVAPLTSEKLAAIREERAQAIADLKKVFSGKKRSNNTYGTFLPIDPDMAVAVARILKTYAQEGIVRAEDFIARFRQDVGTAEETGFTDEDLRVLVATQTSAGTPDSNAVPALATGEEAPVQQPQNSTTDLLTAMWYSNTLSSPMTHVVNSVANTYQTAMESLIATGNVAVQGGKVAAPMRGLARGLQAGAKQAAEVLRTGETVSEEGSKFEIPTALETRDKTFGGARGALANAGTAPLGRTALNLTIAAQKYVPRLLKAADIFYQTGLREMRAWELAAVEAAKEGRTEPSRNTWEAIYEKLANTTERHADATATATAEGRTGRAHALRVWELMEQSRKQTLGAEATEQTRLYAARAVFNGEMEGTLGVIFTAVNTAVERIGPVARYVVPFAKVITNVANGYSDYTLLGVVRAAKGGVGFQRYGEQYRRYTTEERAKVLAKSMLGAVVMASLYAATHREDERDNLELSGPGPQDKNLREQLQQNGWLPYSVKVGEKWLSYKETPLFFVLGAIGALTDYERYEGARPDTDPSYPDKASVLLFQTMGLVVETTPTKGLADLLTALTSPAGKEMVPYLSRLATSAATGYVPASALLRQFSREVQAFSGADKKMATTAWQKIQQDLPVFRDKLRPALDALGEPVKVRTDRLLADKPTHRDQPTQQVWDMLLAKNVALPIPHQRTLVVPAWQEAQDVPGKRVSEWKEGPPSDALYYQFLQVRGRLLKAALLAELPELKQATPPVARQRVQALAQEATRQAKYELAREKIYAQP